MKTASFRSRLMKTRNVAARANASPTSRERKLAVFRLALAGTHRLLLPSAVVRQEHHDSLDSTSAQALRLLAQGERGPVLITAATQSAGRGRSGRSWCSPRGGVWMSLLWPAGDPLQRYEAAPLLAGLATLEALEHAADPPLADLAIKWPNDVLVGGRKVAGILCQCEVLPAAGAGLVVGVGVNTNFDPDHLPGDLLMPAAVVRADTQALIEHFVAGFTALLSDLEQHGLDEAVIARIRRRLAYMGQTVSWQTPAASMQGVVRDLGPRGELLLQVLDGGTIGITSGEVRHVRPR